MNNYWWVSPALTLFGFGVGIFGASWQQDRNRKIRIRTCARAVRADLRRIAGELGHDEGRGIVVAWNMSAPPPQIHEWVSPMVTDLADERSDIIPTLLTIQRDLDYLGFEVRRARAAIGEHVKAVGEVIRRHGGPIPPGTTHHSSHFELIAEAEGVADSRQKVVTEAHREIAAIHARLLVCISNALAIVDPIADRFIPLFPFLDNEEVRVQRWGPG
jgi:hypothetical protein